MLKELISKITGMIDLVLPNNVRCAFVLLDTNTNTVTSASNMSDEDTILLFEEAIETLKNPDEEDFVANIDNSKICN